VGFSVKLKKRKPPRWHKMRRAEYEGPEQFLRCRENFCVAACARFIKREPSQDHVWTLPGPEGGIAALLLHSRRSLLPVFNGNREIPLPRFLKRFLIKVPIHAVQGLREDAEILEEAMETRGYRSADTIDYYLMALDTEPPASAFRSGPKGLIIRLPAERDTDEIFRLQAAYEQEEVLPRNGVFNAAASRLSLEHVLAREQVLVAELDGMIVGKINTNGHSFTRCQIGGVYVRPDCRGMGIGLKMAAAFFKILIMGGNRATLFVKKRNAAAMALYRRLGFTILDDYRISYY
jgi:ribosomal protein S18 acetylase RimI-like enzyme